MKTLRDSCPLLSVTDGIASCVSASSPAWYMSLLITFLAHVKPDVEEHPPQRVVFRIRAFGARHYGG
jgi:hypothetical protein